MAEEAAVIPIGEAAVESITKAIEGMMIATTPSEIRKINISMTEDITKALDKNLAKETKDTLGQSGVQMLGEAITAIPSQEVTETLYQSINKLLWVFHDDDFVRMERLVRCIHALERGDKPPTDEDPESEEDEDEEEDKCRLPEEVTDDILGFMVFDNEECEGDVVNWFGVKWNKLLKLIDDPVGGPIVIGLLNVIFDREPLDEVDTAGGSGLVLVAEAKRKVGVKALHFQKVRLRKIKINNVKGSSRDHRESSWLRFWEKGYNHKSDPCNIAKESPPLSKPHIPNKNLIGGHVWPSNEVGGKYYYILPICKSHNAHTKWDFPPAYLQTNSKARSLKIAALRNVADKANVIKDKLRPAGKFGLVRSSAGCESTIAKGGTPTDMTDGPPSLDPFMQWLKSESLKLAKTFSAGPIENVTKQITKEVLSKAGDLIKEAGSAIRVSSLDSDTMKKFKDKMHTKIAADCDDMKGEQEQKRRRGLLNSETQKVIEGREWKDALQAFESKVKNWVEEHITN